MIDTRLVLGFKGAGKTTYISDCISNDYFYKYGKTLIICFEQGKNDFDTEALLERNASVVYYDGLRKMEEFCSEQIARYSPDRIYVEMSTKLLMTGLQFPEVMNVTAAVTWIDWATLDGYYGYFRQELNQMVSISRQITFRGCPSKDLLAPYSQGFKLMNPDASYLREDALGYHEKAFDLFVPYSLEEDVITISAKEYLIFWLDATDHPEHYNNKLLCFPDPLELRAITGSGSWSAGRVVMTCCMADLQFMSHELIGAEAISGGWATMEAYGHIVMDEYGQKSLKLKPEKISPAAAPEGSTILQAV